MKKKKKITGWWIRNANVFLLSRLQLTFLFHMSKNSIIVGKLSPYLLFPIRHFSVWLLRGKSKKIHFAHSFSHNRRLPQKPRIEMRGKNSFTRHVKYISFLFFFVVGSGRQGLIWTFFDFVKKKNKTRSSTILVKCLKHISLILEQC